MQEKPRRRKATFSLRQICWLMLLCGLVVGWWTDYVRMEHKIEREKQSLREADQMLRRAYARQKALDDDELLKAQVDLRYANKRVQELEAEFGR
jgi:hypothetical protein